MKAEQFVRVEEAQGSNPSNRTIFAGKAEPTGSTAGHNQRHVPRSD
jgi:hypothetical protein